MRKDADWRGSPTATSRREFNRLLSIINPSKSDVFYDLGCGYGRPCIWISPKVKMSIGIEDHYYRYLRARAAVAKSKLDNVIIIRGDIMDQSYHDATIVFSVISVGFQMIKKIQEQAKLGTRIILYGLPPYPIKTKTLFSEYVLMKTPVERVSDVDEFARKALQSEKATIQDLMDTLDEDQKRDLKREIRASEHNWKSLSNHE